MVILIDTKFNNLGLSVRFEGILHKNGNGKDRRYRTIETTLSLSPTFRLFECKHHQGLE